MLYYTLLSCIILHFTVIRYVLPVNPTRSPLYQHKSTTEQTTQFPEEPRTPFIITHLTKTFQNAAYSLASLYHSHTMCASETSRRTPFRSFCGGYVRLGRGMCFFEA